jgi:hypothetical protein
MSRARLSRRLDGHFSAVSALAAAAAIGGAISSADATIVYSGVVNLPVANNVNGIYLNVVTGAHNDAAGTTGASAAPGWDINIYFGIDFYGSGNPGYAYVASGTSVAALPVGSVIDSTTCTATGSTSGPAFTAGTTGLYYGFRFQNEGAGNALQYGWAQYEQGVGGGPGTLIDYAYEDSGAGIAAGATTSGGPSGACCKSDGTCSILSPTQCASAGGTYAGDGSTCAGAGCAPGGACCLAGGTCAAKTSAACTAAGGTWNGAGSTCATTQCPGTWVESGDAGNLLASAQFPTGTGGLFRIVGNLDTGGDADVYAINICDHANFSATTVGFTTTDTVLCLFDGSGHGVSYDDDNPADGGATFQSTITGLFVPQNGNYYLAITTFGSAPTSAGQLIWNATPYEPERQPDGPGAAGVLDGWTNGGGTGTYTIGLTGTCYPSTIGACCFADGTCSPNQSLSACVGAGGVFNGASSCASANCPQPGACCMPNGTCSGGLQGAACAAQGGVYAGNGTTCAGANCPPAGACCASGGCQLLTSAACAAASGTYHGDNSTCAAASCPLVYFYDDGTEEDAVGFGGSSGNGLAYANQFTALAGANQIIDIKVAFGVTSVLNGLPVTAYLWSDPNQDGNPADAQVIAQVSGVISGAVDAEPNPSPTFVTFTIPPTTIPVGQKFFAGFAIQNAPASYPCGLDETSPLHKSWIGYVAGGTFDPNAWTNTTNEDVIAAGNWLIRADAAPSGPSCYANCDGNTTVPFLNVADFTCFLQKFAQGNAYANCDGSTSIPTLNVADFTCFLQKFAQGCSAP